MTGEQPAWRPPPGAVDAHVHVFGPADRFPYAPERTYTPDDAPKEALFALRDRLGFARNVIVQPACYAADHACLLDALEAAGDRARGVAVIGPATTDAQLQRLHNAGVRAIRFTLVRRLAEPQPDYHYRALAERIRPLGWHVAFYAGADDLMARRELLATMPTVTVIDHMGVPDVSEGPSGPPFQQLLHLLAAHPHLWIKTSCSERISRAGPPTYADALPFARTLVEAAPDRVLWGTDWPHPNLASHIPDDARLADLIPLIAPTPSLRNRLLVHNPARLYWNDRTAV